MPPFFFPLPYLVRRLSSIMPGLFSLPPELLTVVLDDALADCNLRNQCRLMHVNSQWHDIIQQRVYSKWTYEGVKQSFKSLWSFVLTVLRNPKLAARVTTLHIGNWGLNHYMTFGEYFDHQLHGWDIICEALHRVGAGSLVSRVYDDVSRGDRRPVMAVLLTALPNVTVVDAHIPPSDPVLVSTLEKILEKRMLPHLSEVRLQSEVSTEIEGVDTPLQIANVWPLMLLPSVRSVSILHLDPEGASALLANVTNPKLQELTLVFGKIPNGIVEDIHALLAVPETLTRLSIYLTDTRNVSERESIIQLLNNDS